MKELLNERFAYLMITSERENLEEQNGDIKLTYRVNHSLPYSQVRKLFGKSFCIFKLGD